MRAKQDWSVGQQVKVGFMSLEVLEKVATPGNYAPDGYILTTARGQLYAFVPHHGLRGPLPDMELAREECWTV